jgi:hypothetical protein
MYIANRPLRVNDKTYICEERIPAGVIDPVRAKTLEIYGLIRKAPETTPGQAEADTLHPAQDSAQKAATAPLRAPESTPEGTMPDSRENAQPGPAKPSKAAPKARSTSSTGSRKGGR